MQFHVQMIPAEGSPELEEEFNQFLRSHKRWLKDIEPAVGEPEQQPGQPQQQRGLAGPRSSTSG